MENTLTLPIEAVSFVMARKDLTDQERMERMRKTWGKRWKKDWKPPKQKEATKEAKQAITSRMIEVMKTQGPTWYSGETHKRRRALEGRRKAPMPLNEMTDIEYRENDEE